MLENINILGRYDETPKNKKQMSLFLEDIICQLDELEHEKNITTEDEFALCDISYVLDDIYTKYRELVYDNMIYVALGLCHVLRQRSVIDSIYKGD